MSRESFTQSMTTALGHVPALAQGQPGGGDLQAYFQTLRQDPDGALAAYEEYAGSFYVHISRATRGRTTDVVWPGGTCDRWDELAARPRRQHQRVIDCEGYAYLGAELLTAAGWDLIGYMVLYLPTQTDPADYHMVAVLEFPGMLARRVYIGTARPRASWRAEAGAVWPHDAQNARTGGYGGTAQEAYRRVMQQVERGAAREIAPLRGRPSFAPPPALD